MRITERRLRSIIRSVLLESPRQYDHISSYEELKDFIGDRPGNMLSKLIRKIALDMCNCTASTKPERDAKRTMYESMCQDMGLVRFADDIIRDANYLYRDPFFP